MVTVELKNTENDASLEFTPYKFDANIEPIFSPMRGFNSGGAYRIDITVSIEGKFSITPDKIQYYLDIIEKLSANNVRIGTP